MLNHYIPRLLLKQFAFSENKVSVCNVKELSFSQKKIKNTFALKDTFDSELETVIANKLEGPFGDLLNHVLLSSNSFTINREQNLLIRKFCIVNNLRSPSANGSYDEMVDKLDQHDNPQVKAREFLIRHTPQLKELLEKHDVSKEKFIPNLKKVMEYDSFEELYYNTVNNKDVPLLLVSAVETSWVTATAFWDCSDSGFEFILPKFIGVSVLDNMGYFYKPSMISGLIEENNKKRKDDFLSKFLKSIKYGSMMYNGNFSLYPISPTRMLVFFSPYFKLFFPIRDAVGIIKSPPLLKKEHFDNSFFEPMRMELFEPCGNLMNSLYKFKVKQLTRDEVLSLNALLLNMEPDEFVFHDYNKIRESFYYYEKKAKFAHGQKKDLSRLI